MSAELVGRKRTFEDYRQNLFKGHSDGYAQTAFAISNDGLKVLEKNGRIRGVIERTPEWDYLPMTLVVRPCQTPIAISLPSNVFREGKWAYAVIIRPEDLKRLKEKNVLDLHTTMRWAYLLTENHEEGKMYFV